MSAYTVSFSVRYEIPSLQRQTEVAMMHCVTDISNEAIDAPDHANRLAWANYANGNSSGAVMPFLWPVATNPAVVNAVTEDPTGATVLDSDVQFIVNGALDKVIADWVKNNP
jgi:hypothetical protein